MQKVIANYWALEIAFYISTLAGAVQLVADSLQSYPGDLVPQSYLIIASVVSAAMMFVSGAMIKRSQNIPVPSYGDSEEEPHNFLSH